MKQVLQQDTIRHVDSCSWLWITWISINVEGRNCQSLIILKLAIGSRLNKFYIRIYIYIHKEQKLNDRRYERHLTRAVLWHNTWQLGRIRSNIGERSHYQHYRRSNELLLLTVCILSDIVCSTLESFQWVYIQDTRALDSGLIHLVVLCDYGIDVHVGVGGQCNSVVTLIELCAFVG